MRANPKAHECSWLIPIHGILRSSKIHGVVGGMGQIDQRTDSKAALLYIGSLQSLASCWQGAIAPLLSLRLPSR